MDLEVGTKIQIGKQYIADTNTDFEAGQVIELVQGYFEEDNGLYCSSVTAPAIWNEREEDFDSIYHLFGNNFEYFKDCKIVSQ